MYLVGPPFECKDRIVRDWKVVHSFEFVKVIVMASKKEVKRGETVIPKQRTYFTNLATSNFEADVCNDFGWWYFEL